MGQALYDYVCSGKNFAALADLAYASGVDRIIKEFPEGFVNVGIAEQNLIGVSAGLANTGALVIAVT